MSAGTTRSTLTVPASRPTTTFTPSNRSSAARTSSTSSRVSTAMSAADTTGKLMLALFGSMLLSLGTAILGALLIASRNYHGVERRATPVVRDPNRVVTP